MNCQIAVSKSNDINDSDIKGTFQTLDNANYAIFYFRLGNRDKFVSILKDGKVIVQYTPDGIIKYLDWHLA